jgi:hypothetical protein
MAAATCAANRARRAALAASAALAIRRAWSLQQLRRCRAWRASRLTMLQSAGTASGPRIDVIVPLYEEQPLVVQIVGFWRGRCAEDARLCVQLVTTEKEGSGEGTTAALVRDELARTPGRGVEHRHVAEVHHFRAVQLNAAVDAVRRCTDCAADAIWIGVYNADSQPSASTFAELRTMIATDPATRAYQQLAQYVVPRSRPASTLMESFAALQTWWTYTTYFARNQRARSAGGWWARTSPFSTFGHGEFFRLDLLDEVGCFPDFAYADGLLVGWLVRLNGDGIGLLASPDVAEVPRRPRQIVGQHRAWIRGLLNARAAERNAPRPGGLSDIERHVLVATHLAIPVAWGLRPPCAALSALWAVGQLIRGSRREGMLVLGALALFAFVPQLASRALAQPVAKRGASRRRLLRRLLGTPSTLVIDGLGFWPAAWDAARADRPAPPKTPR